MVSGIKRDIRIIDWLCKALAPEKGYIGADITFQDKVEVIGPYITGILAAVNGSLISKAGFPVKLFHLRKCREGGYQ